MKNVQKNSRFVGLLVSLVGFLISFTMGAQASDYAKPDFAFVCVFFGLCSLFFVTAKLCTSEK